MGKYLGAEMIVYLPILLLLVGLIFSVSVDAYISKKHRQIMLIIVALILSLVAQDYLSYLVEMDGTNPLVRTLVSIYGYSVRPVILLLFFYIVGARKSYWPFWVLVGVNVLIHLTALFSGICFTISADNRFHRGPLGYSCHIVSGVLLFYLLYLSIREFSPGKKTETWIPVVNGVLIIASVVADSLAGSRLNPVSFLTIAMVGGILFYYIWLHLQFVRRHEQALQAEQRIQIMMTQIQPHFLFNTIATFKALCRKDPEKAADVADKFGAYLRQNLDSLSMSGRIPFRRELEHTKLYTDIEAVRFENIRVEYDIADDDFTVPPLVLQPMVENAIRHGVRIREDGRILVKTCRRPPWHEIMIEDNGVGLNPEAVESLDESHIGIRNVRERIETMCGGTLHIDSRPDVGTTVTIRIPAQEEAR